MQLLLADEEWAARSDRWIAEQCRVCDKTVAKIRAEREQLRNSAVDEPHEAYSMYTTIARLDAMVLSCYKHDSDIRRG